MLPNYAPVKLVDETDPEDSDGECLSVGSCYRTVANSPVFDFGASMKTLLILILSLGACVYCYFFCFYCTLLIIVFCFAFCACAPYLNIPLWVAILFLLIGGFTWFPNENLQISWGKH